MYGLDLGYPMIDTAEMYGDGGAEEIVGDALQGRTSLPYIVSKVYPHNATRSGTVAACERSLKRMRIDRIDLYLLHWRGDARIEETFEAFHRLRDAGKIADFGVSNFDLDDMEDAAGLDKGLNGSNQVLYCLSRRGPEFDLLPWMRKRSIPLMAYSPLDQGGLLRKASLKKLADEVGCTPAQLALEGEHPEFGAVTLSQLLATWVAHDLGHVAQVAREVVGEAPHGGAMFVFGGKRATRVKVLWWDRNGLCLLYKRLHQAVFELPAPDGARPSARIEPLPNSGSSVGSSFILATTLVPSSVFAASTAFR